MSSPSYASASLALSRPGDDDMRAFVARQQRYGAGDAAASADHHNGFVLQRITHRYCSFEHRCKIGMCNPELHGCTSRSMRAGTKFTGMGQLSHNQVGRRVA